MVLLMFSRKHRTHPKFNNDMVYDTKQNAINYFAIFKDDRYSFIHFKRTRIRSILNFQIYTLNVGENLINERCTFYKWFLQKEQQSLMCRNLNGKYNVIVQRHERNCKINFRWKYKIFQQSKKNRKGYRIRKSQKISEILSEI